MYPLQLYMSFQAMCYMSLFLVYMWSKANLVGFLYELLKALALEACHFFVALYKYISKAFQ